MCFTCRSVQPIEVIESLPAQCSASRSSISSCDPLPLYVPTTSVSLPIVFAVGSGNGLEKMASD